MLGFTDGERGFCRNLDRKMRRIFKRYGAFELSFAGVTKTWEKAVLPIPTCARTCRTTAF